MYLILCMRDQLEYSGTPKSKSYDPASCDERASKFQKIITVYLAISQILYMLMTADIVQPTNWL